MNPGLSAKSLRIAEELYRRNLSLPEKYRVRAAGELYLSTSKKEYATVLLRNADLIGTAVEHYSEFIGRVAAKLGDAAFTARIDGILQKSPGAGEEESLRRSVCAAHLGRRVGDPGVRGATALPLPRLSPTHEYRVCVQRPELRSRLSSRRQYGVICFRRRGEIAHGGLWCEQGRVVVHPGGRGERDGIDPPGPAGTENLALFLATDGVRHGRRRSRLHDPCDGRGPHIEQVTPTGNL